MKGCYVQLDRLVYSPRSPSWRSHTVSRPLRYWDGLDEEEKLFSSDNDSLYDPTVNPGQLSSTSYEYDSDCGKVLGPTVRKPTVLKVLKDCGQLCLLPELGVYLDFCLEAACQQAVQAGSCPSALSTSRAGCCASWTGWSTPREAPPGGHTRSAGLGGTGTVWMRRRSCSPQITTACTTPL